MGWEREGVGARENSAWEGYGNATEKRVGCGRNGGELQLITKQRLTFHNRKRDQGRKEGRNTGGSRQSR